MAVISLERSNEGGQPEPLEQGRLLTEVDHLLAYRRGSDVYDVGVLRDVTTNLYAALQEMAMPGAVTKTFHPVSYEADEGGQQQRLFLWLGKQAVDVAISGRKFHSSAAALDRVAVEIAEAGHSQETLRTGVAQVFISPRMSRADAPLEVARHEHLADDDSIRVSRLVTNSQGAVIGRRMESLLVRDIPLEAWVSMLKDSDNIFRRSFVIRNEASALSVMELFEGLELPEHAVPEGPVSLVEAVIPYITQASLQYSVERQLEHFRHGQALYEVKAEQLAEEWLSFERALAGSLYTGRAADSIAAFIGSLQHQWGGRELDVILDHQQEDGGYVMTRELAAALEKAERHILAALAAIATGNEAVVGQMDRSTVEAIRRQEAQIAYSVAAAMPPEAVLMAKADLFRQVARQHVRVGGGCAGVVESAFGDEVATAVSDNGSARRSENKNDWKWTTGTCRVKNCPSPNPTEVGPCSVCRRCQHLFDAGRNPAKTSVEAERPAAKVRPVMRGLSDLLMAAP